jgi:hypothetical protein
MEKIREIHTPEIKLDNWQKEVLETKGNMCICSPRQMGKSTVISQDAGEYGMNNPNKSIMIVASVERQALLLFEKVLSYIFLKDKNMIKKKKDKPTKHELKLTNGTIIRCLPTGDSGYGIRGFTIDRLYADEAAFINEDVWAAITPMLATTGGDIILLSTPFGINNYFYRMSLNPKFHFIHVDPDKVINSRDEPQRTNMLQFRADEKERMTKLQFQQEHLGLFVGGINPFFPEDLINKVCIIDPKQLPKPKECFQGIDIARMGGDECVMCSGNRITKTYIEQFDITIPDPQTLTDTARLIIHKDKAINHKKIYMDDGGLGVGVYDILFEHQQTKRKVVGLNNAKRGIDTELGKKDGRKKALFGTDMAINLKILMEQGKVRLIDDPRIKHSLRSMQFENTDGKLQIYGNYDHIFEALKRMAWCTKDKTLNIYFFQE